MGQLITCMTHHVSWNRKEVQNAIQMTDALLAKLELPFDQPRGRVQALVSRFYHTYVPFLEAYFDALDQTLPVPNVFVSFCCTHRFSYAEDVADFLEKSGVPDILIDRQLTLGSNPDVQLLHAALKCKHFWGVITVSYVQRTWPLRELMIASTRYVRSCNEIRLLFDCLEDAHDTWPKGFWRDRLLELKALRMRNKDGAYRSFPANMQATRSSESFGHGR